MTSKKNTGTGNYEKNKSMGSKTNKNNDN